MTAPRAGWWIVGCLALGTGAGLGWQRFVLAVDRGDLALWRGQGVELGRLQAENRRLAAGQISADELARLRADQAALARLRGEIDVLKRRATEPKVAVESPPPGPPSIPVTTWKNAGHATPAAALETVLWAAAGGDIDAIAVALTFEPKLKARVDAFFASLSEATRTQYTTPERLIALFTAKDVPLGSMQILEQKMSGPDDASLSVRLKTPEGATKESVLSLRRIDEGWKLLVPPGAFQKYASVLAPAGTPGAGKPLVPKQ